MEAAFDVFISYRVRDTAAALELARTLEERGVRPWLADKQGPIAEVWRHEVVDVLRRLPAAIFVAGQKPAGEWGQRELDEIAARKLADPGFRFVVATLPGAARLKPAASPDLIARADPDGWSDAELQAIVDATHGAAAADAGEPIPLSPSVEAALRVSGEVPSFTIVRRLLEAHPEYAGGLDAAKLGPEPPDAEPRTAEAWLTDVRELYDPTRTDVIHGRLLIDGLARVDRRPRDHLQRLGALNRLRAEIQPPPDALLQMPADSVDTLTDYPADVDELGRRVIAEVLARRIRSMRKDEVSRSATNRDRNRRRGGPFLLHLYGPWGMGKTSLLRFMAAELEGAGPQAQHPRLRLPRPRRPDIAKLFRRIRGRLAGHRLPYTLPDRWIVIDFNAWQHQRIAPPWWWLMTAVHRQGSKALRRLDFRRWLVLKAWNIWWRVIGAAPGLLLVAVGLGIGWLAWTSGSCETGHGWSSVSSAVESVVKAFAGAIALGVTIWGGVRAVSRWLVVGSPRAADAFINQAKDPLETLSRRFATLVRRSHYPVAIFVDDLDRCQAKYVVELLEGIQTLFKDVPVTYVVAADREWLCQSYAEEYKVFCESTGQPGRPLGYLFLEKTFQLSAPLPSLSVNAQRDYLQGLLRVARPGGRAELQAARAQARQAFEAASDETEVQAKLEEAGTLPPVERQAAAEA